MWEWSNRLFKKKPPSASKTLLAAYNDLLMQTSSEPKAVGSMRIPSQDTVSVLQPEEMQKILQEKIQTFRLTKLELRECAYDPLTWQEMHNGFSEYCRARAMFFKLLGYSHAEQCYQSGLTKADVKLLCSSYAPENYNTHLKIPLDFGGSLDFENFALIQTHPTHGLLHRLIDFQIEIGYLRRRQKIFVPYFTDKIYHA